MLPKAPPVTVALLTRGTVAVAGTTVGASLAPCLLDCLGPRANEDIQADCQPAIAWVGWVGSNLNVGSGSFDWAELGATMPGLKRPHHFLREQYFREKVPWLALDKR